MTKAIVLIGGNSGIGEAIKLKAQTEGYTVISASRSGDHSTDVLDNEPNFPGIPDNLELHGLVYCPGTINLKPFNRLKLADFQHDINVNYLGAIKAIQHYLPQLQKTENAAIVLFSTVAVQQGMPFHASISGAKGAIEGLTRSLAAELTPKVRVNCVAPSLTETPLAERLLRTDKQKEASALRHPLKRIGSSDDIANAAMYLLGESSGWVTGQILGVDGGMSSVRV